MESKQQRQVASGVRQKIANVRTHLESHRTVTPEALQKLADIERELSDHESALLDEEEGVGTGKKAAAKGGADSK